MKDSLSAAIIRAKSIFFLSLLISISSQYTAAQSLSLDLELLDVGANKKVNISQSEANFLVLITYTANCPFATGYETRIDDLVKEFSSKKVNFMLLNPNVSLALKGESDKEMSAHYKNTNKDIPYLADKNQQLTKMIGLSKIPEAVILKKSSEGWEVVYKGAIDNNPQSEQHANQHFLKEALRSLNQQKLPKQETAVTGGCVIRKF